MTAAVSTIRNKIALKVQNSPKNVLHHPKYLANGKPQRFYKIRTESDLLVSQNFSKTYEVT